MRILADLRRLNGWSIEAKPLPAQNVHAYAVDPAPIFTPPGDQVPASPVVQ